MTLQVSKIAIPFLLITTLLFSCETPKIPEETTTLVEEKIVPANAELEHLFTRAAGIKEGLTEGPAVAPDGSIYFSYIPFGKEKGTILQFHPKTKETTIFAKDSHKSNGLAFDAGGRLIAAEGADYGGRRISSWNVETGKRTKLADNYEGKKFNGPNDLTIDSKGRIYFSDPRYLGHEPLDQPIMGVYRIDTDGSIQRIVSDAGKPNGVCVSPDQKTLYVVSNDNGATGFDRLPEDVTTHKGRMALMAYDLYTDGTAKFRKILVDYYPEDGPDGLTVDVDGNLYVAVRDETRPGICVYSPEGKERAYIPTEVPTNIGFGRGDAAQTLYITAGKSLYRIQLNKAGYQLPDKN